MAMEISRIVITSAEREQIIRYCKQTGKNIYLVTKQRGIPINQVVLDLPMASSIMYDLRHISDKEDMERRYYTLRTQTQQRLKVAFAI